MKDKKRNIWQFAVSREQPRRAVYPGRKENDMTEREIERILSEETDEAKVWEAMEEYLKGVNE